MFILPIDYKNDFIYNEGTNLICTNQIFMEDIKMKLRKIMAGVVATSIAATMAVAASAENTAFLCMQQAVGISRAMTIQVM